MASEYTPGPWQCDSAVMEYEGARFGEVAYVLSKEGEQFPASAANARLIAVAPDLFEALERLKPVLDRAESNASGNMEWDDVSGRINAARAAIARARGGAQ